MNQSRQIKLNPEQKAAVEHIGGPLLIIAGAGTGKTTVITERIKWLITKKGVKPSEILALTFTDKAAREMEERVDVALPYGYSQMWISTFHAFGDRILRNEAVHIGLNPGYKLMTKAEAIMFMRKHLFTFDLDYFRPLGNPTKFVEAMLQHFSRLKDEDIDPKQYLHYAKKQELRIKNQESEKEEASKHLGGGRLKRSRSHDSPEVKSRRRQDKEEIRKTLELAHGYQKYEALKAKEGVVDFADLIGNTVKLFRQRPNILRHYLDQFRYILVDEFQDTNYAQYKLIKLLAPPAAKPNLTMVGDDNQSIYRFRGAAVSNILMFMEDYKRAKTVVLNKNYRSTQTILNHAYKLIKHNDPDTLEAKLGISKNLIAKKNKREFPIEFIFTDRVENEADKVAKTIQQLNNETIEHWKDFAILVRANNHADPFVHALIRNGIPYQFLGPGKLFHQPEIKDLIAYLYLLADLEDSVSCYRVLAMEIFEISPRDLAALVGFAKKFNLPLFDAAEIVASLNDIEVKREDKDNFKNTLPFISKKAKERLVTVIKMIHRHLSLLPKETAGQILYYFLEDTGVLKIFVTFDSVQQERKAANIAKFFDKLKTFEAEHKDSSVYAVVDWIDTRMELGESPLASDIDWSENNAVTILTAHSAKGLEFPVVFMVNLVEGRFPTRKRREKIPIAEELIKEILPTGDFHIEEERRLFYVGMTRAQNRLFLTASLYYGEGKRERKISPFVYEALEESEIKKAKGKMEDKDNNQLFLFDWKKTKELPFPPRIDEEQQTKYKVNFLSYSQIETFRFCPMHYKARYILHLPTPTYAAASFGQTIHTTLKFFYNGLLQGKNWGIDKLLSLYEDIWIPLGYKGKNHQQAMKKMGRKQLIAFFETFHQNEPLPKAVEQPFVFPVKKGLKVGGVIDRIHEIGNGKIEIVDYKTASKVPNQNQVDKNRQLTIYALAATEVKDPLLAKSADEVVLSLYFLGEEKKLTTTRTKKQLDKAKKEIIDIAYQIEESNFACSGATWCKKCEYKLLCSPQT